VADPTTLHVTYLFVHSALIRAQSERGERQDMTYDPRGNPEVAWAAYERAKVLEAVNQVRAEFHLPPVTAEDVFRAEQMAVGHSDYTKKFALYCAELALKENV
jgi:uncharacterized protein YkwD